MADVIEGRRSLTTVAVEQTVLSAMMTLGRWLVSLLRNIWAVFNAATAKQAKRHDNRRAWFF